MVVVAVFRPVPFLCLSFRPERPGIFLRVAFCLARARSERSGRYFHNRQSPSPHPANVRFFRCCRLCRDGLRRPSDNTKACYLQLLTLNCPPNLASPLPSTSQRNFRPQFPVSSKSLVNRRPRAEPATRHSLCLPPIPPISRIRPRRHPLPRTRHWRHHRNFQRRLRHPSESLSVQKQ